MTISKYDGDINNNSNNNNKYHSTSRVRLWKYSENRSVDGDVIISIRYEIYIYRKNRNWKFTDKTKKWLHLPI